VASVINAVLAAARARLHRLTPVQAAAAAEHGALLVDTRPESYRQAHGAIPGAVVVERNVLEWRLDPTSPDRLPEANDAAKLVILFCNQGYASSLAAASLQDLGLFRATDLIGGFEAWKDAGLPVEAGGQPALSGAARGGTTGSRGPAQPGPGG
jgi:rhodanese-related sulfurtransferase